MNLCHQTIPFCPVTITDRTGSRLASGPERTHPGRQAAVLVLYETNSALCSAAVAVKHKAVCFTAVTLFFFILQVDISALAGQIFTILVSFDRNLLQIFVFNNLADLRPKIY